MAAGASCKGSAPPHYPIMRYLHPINSILLAILVAFGAWELTSTFWDEPGDDTMVTLSEYIWLWWPWTSPAVVIMFWAGLHFIPAFRPYDPVMILLRRIDERGSKTDLQ